jgi:molybdate transport system ATP-binding protein
VTANTDGHAFIDVNGIRIEAITPLQPQSRVELYLRPEEVTISLPAPSGQGETSVRNRLSGTITKIVPNGPFMRVTIDCGFPLVALVTRLSSEDLRLAVGTPVIAEIKATAIYVHAVPS